MRDTSYKIKEIIKQHIINNKKEYIIVTSILIVGIFLGVFFVNNIEESQKTEITEYLNHFIDKMKTTEKLDSMSLLKTSITQNIFLAVTIWFFGTTIIGIPVVFGIIMYRGFCLGYTISVCVTVLGLQKGIIFTLINFLLPSIFLIPAMIALAVSGFKLYKSIIKDKNKENIKLELLRHIIFSIIMLCIILISSIIEVFISTNILKWAIKYF